MLQNANATGVLILKNTFDLNGQNRDFQVDNPNFAAVVTGRITDSAAGPGLTKTGSGTLKRRGN